MIVQPSDFEFVTATFNPGDCSSPPPTWCVWSFVLAMTSHQSL